MRVPAAGQAPAGCALGHQDDLAARVALRELSICLAHAVERKGAGDWDLDLAVGDELCELSQQLRRRDRVGALRVYAITLCGLKVGNRVYPLARDAEL